jgi:hypothetical protein
VMGAALEGALAGGHHQHHHDVEAPREEQVFCSGGF